MLKFASFSFIFAPRLLPLANSRATLAGVATDPAFTARLLRKVSCPNRWHASLNKHAIMVTFLLTLQTHLNIVDANTDAKLGWRICACEHPLADRGTFGDCCSSV